MELSPKIPLLSDQGSGDGVGWEYESIFFFTKLYMSSDTPLSELGCKLISRPLLNLKIGPGVWITWIPKTLDWVG